METFELLDRNRIEHGYMQRNLRQYKKFCNKQFRILRKAGATDQASAYKLESNLAKFLLFGSRRYLRKNTRLLKSMRSEFSSLYLRYNECFAASKEGAAPVDKLIELRHQLADFYSFLEDIYTLNDGRHDFEQYKIKYQWNDITLHFETQRMLDSFLNGDFEMKDHRFNTQLALKVFNMERSREEFAQVIGESNAQILSAFGSSEKLFTSVTELYQFLEDNFLHSAFAKELYAATSEVHAFITRLFEYRNGVLHTGAERFEVPALFSDCKKALKALEGRKSIRGKKLREMMLGILEERLSSDFRKRSMPFLPVFYDIAYDFIEYPAVDNDVSETLGNLSFSEKN